MWRLKFRKLPEDFGTGEAAGVNVVKLFDLPVGGGVIGLVFAVQKLLFLELLPFEEDVDEPLVLVLIFRNLLNAPRLDIGGLEAKDNGACDT